MAGEKKRRQRKLVMAMNLMFCKERRGRVALTSKTNGKSHSLAIAVLILIVQWALCGKNQGLEPDLRKLPCTAMVTFHKRALLVWY